MKGVADGVSIFVVEKDGPRAKRRSLTIASILGVEGKLSVTSPGVSMDGDRQSTGEEWADHCCRLKGIPA